MINPSRESNADLVCTQVPPSKIANAAQSLLNACRVMVAYYAPHPDKHWQAGALEAREVLALADAGGSDEDVANAALSACQTIVRYYEPRFPVRYWLPGAILARDAIKLAC